MEVQDSSPKDRSTHSETSIASPSCGHTYTGDSDLRSKIEENAFQALSEGPLIKRPRYTFCVPRPEEDNDFLSLTFPRKLWKIVGSDHFKSIWWDENGTSIVINEELFKKEVLERKTPFRIFETESMKSLVRQLNLYGFSKVRQNCQRSASLADFLAEEKEASVLSKLQFYQHPNFKRGCPQLLVNMKRRVGIKNASTVSASLVQDFNKKHFRAVSNADNQNSGAVAETSRERLLSASTNVNVPLIRQPSNSQEVASTTPLVRSVFSPSSASITPSEQILTDKHGVLNQLTTFHMQSHSSYTQANGYIVNFVRTATSVSQYHIVSPIENNYSGLMVEPPSVPTGYPDLPAHEASFSTFLQGGNPWLPMAVIPDLSATSLLRSSQQPSSLYQHFPHFS
ncbi:heat shock transcription factor, Y-linked-like [Dasypus novemcinctus]|uniref:heat shock transcription factor, Y-linked-like n=1 Tax=Dasypus novemcinctus TaxID=9361 RepID=UPI0039C9D5FE